MRILRALKAWLSLAKTQDPLIEPACSAPDAEGAIVLLHEDEKVALAITQMTAVPSNFKDLTLRKVDDVEQTQRAQLWRWYALPGQRLELANTGFVISLTAMGDGRAFALHDPEGRLCGHSDLLPQLKAWGEKLASWRDEFSCMPTSPSCSDRGG